MANQQNKESPNSVKALIVGGGVTFLAGCITLLASGARMEVDFPGLDSIPNPLFNNLDTVTAKLANSGMILIFAGFGLIVASLIYAGYKINSSPSDSTQENRGNAGQTDSNDDPLTLN